jgi:bromodomain-containing factor 1
LKLWDLCKKVLPGFAKDSAGPTAVESRPPKQSKTTAGKPKKNKPMSAQEQEARIAQLTALRQMYKDGNDVGDVSMGGSSAPMQQSPPIADSSDDSDSEEE